ncbi:recombination protein RecR [Candidatus Peregrinibacteria bacterium CG11_big_fil_rev_8_21_14_0_20_46_8]|nr:MAG: recombination protein RecR [Candidatus Peregrinibacteria bacterium CG11_big_fil_rev_8_21_14_0_20_46_8]
MFPPSIQKLIDSFAKLPGVGKKTAQHYAYFLLRSHRTIARDLSDALRSIEQGITLCRQCQMLCDGALCGTCMNPKRDQRTICVVEQIFDLEAIEKSKEYTGVYHVLHGRISPLDKIAPEDLKIKELIDRVKKLSGEIEIILATNPSNEGEATAIYIQKLLAPFNLKITRIATGIPVGADLEYADEVTLGRAIKGRQKYD